MLNQQMINQQISNLGGQVKETTDSRSLLEKFRKSGLYRLLRANGHEIDENMDHEKMLHYAQAFEEKLDFSKVIITPDGFGGYSVRKPIEHVMEERAFDEKVQGEKKAYNEMTRPELMKLAKEKGLTVTVSDTSASLIAALTGTIDEQNPS